MPRGIRILLDAVILLIVFLFGMEIGDSCETYRYGQYICNFNK